MTEDERRGTVDQGRTPPRSVSIGITGGIGAGKSTALAMFRELGAETLSADSLVHELYEQPEIREALRERFGDVVLGRTGAVDRSALARIVAVDPEKLAWLEAYVHPRVGKLVREALNRLSDRVVACEVPLLFESGTEGLFDVTVTIEAARDVRIGRSGGGLRSPVREALELRQLGTEGRSARADLVFVNDGTLDVLRDFVRDVYGQARLRLESDDTSREPERSTKG